MAIAAGTQLNWLARYVPLLPHLDRDARASLLEVGSGAVGLASVLGTPFVGADVAFAGAPRSPLRAVEYGGRRLPFRTAAFDTVVTMDTLEHVAPADRPGFLAEVTRVAARRVLVGCPAGSAGIAVDRWLAEIMHRLGTQVPEWLREHEAHGLPDPAAIAAALETLGGWRWREVPTTGTLQCILLTLADLLPDLAGEIASLLQNHGDRLAEWMRAASFGPSFRRVYLLERNDPVRPLARTDDGDIPAETLTCPACDGQIARATAPRAMASDPEPAADAGCARGRVSAAPGGAPRVRRAPYVCRSCTATYAPDARDVLVLKPPSKAVAHEPVTFVLRPDLLHRNDWIVPVHNYLHAFAADAACVLWVAVDPTEVNAHEALEILRPLIEPFGDAPFPQLTLSDDPSERPPGRTIELPSRGDELARWTPETFQALHREASRA